jgi:hypothetical protein
VITTAERTICPFPTFVLVTTPETQSPQRSFSFEFVIAYLQLSSVFEPFLSFDYVRGAFSHPSIPKLVDYKLRQFPPSHRMTSKPVFFIGRHMWICGCVAAKNGLAVSGSSSSTSVLILLSSLPFRIDEQGSQQDLVTYCSIL